MRLELHTLAAEGVVHVCPASSMGYLGRAVAPVREQGYDELDGGIFGDTGLAQDTQVGEGPVVPAGAPIVALPPFPENVKHRPVRYDAGTKRVQH